MLKERRVWKVLSTMEERVRKSKLEPKIVDIRELLRAVLGEKGLVTSFHDLDDVKRTLDSMEKDGSVAYNSVSTGNAWVNTVKTVARSNELYALPYFLPRIADAFGFWKILSAIIAIISLWPGGVVSQLVVVIFK